MISRNSIGRAYPIIRLGEAVEFLDSKRRPVTESDRRAGPYPYFGANGQQGTIADYIFDEPLVLLAEDGGHFGDPNHGIAYRISGKAWVNNHAHVLRPNPDVDLAFLCHVLENYDVTPFVTGTTRGKLTKAGASEIVIPCPPLAEQRRIAKVLDQAEELKAKRRAALAQLDILTQAIFLDLFGDPATNPKGWPISKISDLLESASYGTSEKAGTTGEFPVLRMNNITRTGEINLTDLKFMHLPTNKRERYLVRAGDVLFNRTNSAELVGKSAIYRDKRQMAYAGYLVRLRTDDKNDPEYLSAFLNTSYAKKMLRGMCKSIIGMANINATEVQAMKIAHPPTPLQREFARRVAAIDKLKAAHRTSLVEFDTLFAALQHRAFRGEL